MPLNKVKFSAYAQVVRGNLLYRGVRSIWGQIEPEGFVFAPYVEFGHDALCDAIFDLKVFIGRPDGVEYVTWLVESKSRGSNVVERVRAMLGFAESVIDDGFPERENIVSFVHVRLNGVLVSVATLGKKSPDPVENS